MIISKINSKSIKDCGVNTKILSPSGLAHQVKESGMFLSPLAKNYATLLVITLKSEG